jgi:hypothetical protein
MTARIAWRPEELAEYIRARGGTLTIAVRPYLIG